MFWFVIAIGIVAASFAAGYFVGSNNPAKSVIEKLKKQIKDKL